MDQYREYLKPKLIIDINEYDYSCVDVVVIITVL